jgi:hypothetical protein
MFFAVHGSFPLASSLAALFFLFSSRKASGSPEFTRVRIERAQIVSRKQLHPAGSRTTVGVIALPLPPPLARPSSVAREVPIHHWTGTLPYTTHDDRCCSCSCCFPHSSVTGAAQLLIHTSKRSPVGPVDTLPEPPHARAFHFSKPFLRTRPPPETMDQVGSLAPCFPPSAGL